MTLFRFNMPLAVTFTLRFPLSVIGRLMDSGVTTCRSEILVTVTLLPFSVKAPEGVAKVMLLKMPLAGGILFELIRLVVLVNIKLSPD